MKMVKRYKFIVCSQGGQPKNEYEAEGMRSVGPVELFDETGIVAIVVLAPGESVKRGDEIIKVKGKR